MCQITRGRSHEALAHRSYGPRHCPRSGFRSPVCFSDELVYMVVSSSRETPIQTSRYMILIMGTPKRVPLTLGNPDP